MIAARAYERLRLLEPCWAADLNIPNGIVVLPPGQIKAGRQAAKATQNCEKVASAVANASKPRSQAPPGNALPARLRLALPSPQCRE